MKYNNTLKAELIKRINRFVALVKIGNQIETVHVKNTGRCKELLLPGATVYLTKSENLNRKTAYDLISVFKDSANKIVNIDSQAPNQLIAEWLKDSNLFSRDVKIRREVTYNDSRFDFYVTDNERKAFIEVKGVTLEDGTVALFPDAPTERGVKHLRELVSATEKGYEAYIIFVLQMKGPKTFTPNKITHNAFAETLRYAKDKGVKTIAVDCIVDIDSIVIDTPVEVVL